MKFKFNKDVSRIFDYLTFPRLFYYFDKEHQENNESISQIISKDFTQFVNQTIESFKPYEEIISKFYKSDVYSSFDFIQILIKAYAPYNYISEEKYLNDLLETDEAVFRKSFIKALLSLDQEDDEEIDDDIIDESHAIDYINGLKLDASNKWNLLMTIQDPKKSLRECIDLLKKIEHLFYDYYQSKEKEVTDIGIDISTRLDVNPNKMLKEISYHTVSYDFSGYDTCDLYVSSVFPYTLRFIENESCKIVWGIKMEYSFKKIHEINEDKMTQRVKVFKALGDKTRYDTLRLIANGVSSIKDIAKKLDVSSATISYHMNEFLTSGIISLNRQREKKFYYLVDYEKLNDVFTEMKKDLSFPE